MDHCLQNNALAIVPKAKTKQELLHVVCDFEKQIGKVNGILLAAAARTAAKMDSCPPSVAANLLSQIPKDMKQCLKE